MTVEAKLRINAQLDGAVAALKRLQTELQGTGRATDAADRSNAFGKTRQGLQSIGEQLNSLRTQFLAFVGIQQGAQGVAALASMSDGYASMNARLRIATRNNQEFSASLAEVKAIAAQFSQPLAEISTLYTRMLSAVAPLGGGVQEASIATRAMAASLKISGATAAESASAILQFSQAMSAGALRGEEFNSMADAAPRLLEALAAGMGKTRGELKGLAEQGQLTTNAVIKALGHELPKLEQQAALIPGTISGAYRALIDALNQYVGSQSEANGAGQIASGVIKALAANIQELVTALTLLAGLAFASVITKAGAALVAMGAGAVGATAGVTGLRLAMTGLLTLVGGPAGLIVKIGLLAAAWLGLEVAKQGAKQRTLADAQRERDAVQSELDALNEGIKKAGSLVAPQAMNERILLRAKLARLNGEVFEREDGAKDAMNSAYWRTLSPAGKDLADPAGVKKFEDDYKDRLAIVKEYEDRRANYIRAKDIDIAKARSAGDEAQATSLERQKARALKEQAHEHKEKLKAFDKSHGAFGPITRVAQATDTYSRPLELQADALARAQKELQDQFEQGIDGLASYLQRKAKLQDDAHAKDIERIQDQLAAERTALALNYSRQGTAKDANAREQFEQAIAGNRSQIEQLEAQLTVKTRDRVDAAKALTREGENYLAKLRAQAQAIEDMTAQTLGNESEQSIADRIQRSAKANIEAEIDLGGDGRRSQALANAQVFAAIFAKRQADLQRARDALALQEDDLRLAQTQGRASEEETEARILALRKEQLPVLQALIAKLAEMASTPEQKAQLAKTQQELKGLQDFRTDVQRQLTEVGRSGFGSFFADVLAGTKTVKGALNDMLASFARSMLEMISKRLGAKLFESFGMGRVIDVGASWITSLFGFHSGGIVGPGGASFTRAMPAGLASLAAQIAPRYHSGGIVGLRANERLAVLEDGEEVLTADNPRHRYNQRSGGTGGVTTNVSVTVNASAGTDAQRGQAAGNDLGRAIKTFVDQWAIQELRPGGKLARA